MDRVYIDFPRKSNPNYSTVTFYKAMVSNYDSTLKCYTDSATVFQIYLRHAYTYYRYEGILQSATLYFSLLLFGKPCVTDRWWSMWQIIKNLRKVKYQIDK